MSDFKRVGEQTFSATSDKNTHVRLKYRQLQFRICASDLSPEMRANLAERVFDIIESSAETFKCDRDFDYAGKKWKIIYSSQIKWYHRLLHFFFPCYKLPAKDKILRFSIDQSSRPADSISEAELPNNISSRSYLRGIRGKMTLGKSENPFLPLAQLAFERYENRFINLDAFKPGSADYCLIKVGNHLDLIHKSNKRVKDQNCRDAVQAFREFILKKYGDVKVKEIDRAYRLKLDQISVLTPELILRFNLGAEGKFPVFERTGDRNYQWSNTADRVVKLHVNDKNTDAETCYNVAQKALKELYKNRDWKNSPTRFLYGGQKWKIVYSSHIRWYHYIMAFFFPMYHLPAKGNILRFSIERAWIGPQKVKKSKSSELGKSLAMSNFRPITQQGLTIAEYMQGIRAKASPSDENRLYQDSFTQLATLAFQKFEQEYTAKDGRKPAHSDFRIIKVDQQILLVKTLLDNGTINPLITTKSLTEAMHAYIALMQRMHGKQKYEEINRFYELDLKAFPDDTTFNLDLKPAPGLTPEHIYRFNIGTTNFEMQEVESFWEELARLASFSSEDNFLLHMVEHNLPGIVFGKICLFLQDYFKIKNVTLGHLRQWITTFPSAIQDMSSGQFNDFFSIFNISQEEIEKAYTGKKIQEFIGSSYTTAENGVYKPWIDQQELTQISQELTRCTTWAAYHEILAHVVVKKHLARRNKEGYRVGGLIPAPSFVGESWGLDVSLCIKNNLLALLPEKKDKESAYAALAKDFSAKLAEMDLFTSHQKESLVKLFDQAKLSAYAVLAKDFSAKLAEMDQLTSHQKESLIKLFDQTMLSDYAVLTKEFSVKLAEIDQLTSHQKESLTKFFDQAMLSDYPKTTFEDFLGWKYYEVTSCTTNQYTYSYTLEPVGKGSRLPAIKLYRSTAGSKYAIFASKSIINDFNYLNSPGYMGLKGLKKLEQDFFHKRTIPTWVGYHYAAEKKIGDGKSSARQIFVRLSKSTKLLLKFECKEERSKTFREILREHDAILNELLLRYQNVTFNSSNHIFASFVNYMKNIIQNYMQRDMSSTMSSQDIKKDAIKLKKLLKTQLQTLNYKEGMDSSLGEVLDDAIQFLKEKQYDNALNILNDWNKHNSKDALKLFEELTQLRREILLILELLQDIDFHVLNVKSIQNKEAAFNDFMETVYEPIQKLAQAARKKIEANQDAKAEFKAWSALIAKHAVKRGEDIASKHIQSIAFTGHSLGGACAEIGLVHNIVIEDRIPAPTQDVTGIFLDEPAINAEDNSAFKDWGHRNGQLFQELDSRLRIIRRQEAKDVVPKAGEEHLGATFSDRECHQVSQWLGFDAAVNQRLLTSLDKQLVEAEFAHETRFLHGVREVYQSTTKNPDFRSISYNTRAQGTFDSRGYKGETPLHTGRQLHDHLYTKVWKLPTKFKFFFQEENRKSLRFPFIFFRRLVLSKRQDEHKPQPWDLDSHGNFVVKSPSTKRALKV